MIGILYSLLFCLHPIHVSVTEIKHNEKVKAVEIISRIFIDDLELAVQKQINEPGLDLLNPGKGRLTEKLVEAYLNEHLKIGLEGKPQVLHFLGLEREDLALLCYIEIQNARRVTQVEVLNDVIMEVHDDQSNLVHVTLNGMVKSARLMRDKPTDTFTFDKK